MAKKNTTPAPVRNRIKRHARVRAGDLIPHESNFRTHPKGQEAALRALYAEVGFARSLLAYELPDGRLKLIDGHLRRDIDPDMEVEVEILDVTDEEAKKLLALIDPLAALAGTDAKALDALLRDVQTGDEALAAVLTGLAEGAGLVPAEEADGNDGGGGGDSEKAKVKCPHCGEEFTP